MKELGHSYIAEHVFGLKGNNKIYIGVAIPDLVWYTSARSVLEDADLHGEGAEKLYHFVKKNHPEFVPLARAVLTHGLLYGADLYNDKKYNGGTGFAYRHSPSLEEDVAICCQIDRATAKTRAHNFIEMGLDLHLARDDSSLASRVETGFADANLGAVSQLLADCFNIDVNLVRQGLDEFAGCYHNGDLYSAEGLARIFARQSSFLPDGDQVNVPMAAKIIEDAAELIENDYQHFLNEIVILIKQNLSEHDYL